MSEVIKTDFVLGKLDGKLFESAAKLIDRELRQFNNPKKYQIHITQMN